MNAPKTRGQAIAACCRQCIYDKHAHGTWTEQVGACTAVECPLWRFRPLPANAPAWLRTRDPKRLPDGFITPDTDHVLALIHGDAADSQRNPENRPSVDVETPRAPDPVQPQGVTRATPPVMPETRGFGGSP